MVTVFLCDLLILLLLLARSDHSLALCQAEVAIAPDPESTVDSPDPVINPRGCRETKFRACFAGASRDEPGNAGPSVRPTASGRQASGTGTNRPIPPAQPEVLIRQLCTFLQKEGGSAASSHVVNHFRDRISSRDKALFRQLLKQIADLQKGVPESKWVLKPDYQEQ